METLETRLLLSGGACAADGYFEIPVSAEVRPAANGELEFVEAVLDDDGAFDGLNEPKASVISPDGGFVYVISGTRTDGAIAVLRRDPATGAVEMVQGLTQPQVNDPSDVEISPDGKQVYVSDQEGDKIVVFDRDVVTGELAYASTCHLRLSILDGPHPYDLSISSDGTSLYASGKDNLGLGVYQRNPATGAIVEVQRISGSTIRDHALSGDGEYLYASISSPPGVAMYSRDTATGLLTEVGQVDNSGLWWTASAKPNWITISPDGTWAYIATFASGTLQVFTRDTLTGELSWARTVTLAGLGVGDQMTSATTCTMSADGERFFISDGGTDAVGVFARDAATGSLSAVDVVRRNVDGVEGLDGPGPVTLSADGAYAYVAGFGSDTLSVFACDTTGALAQIQVARQDMGGINGFSDATDVALSSDGLHAYVAGGDEDAVAVFAVDPATGRTTFVQVLRYGDVSQYTTSSVDAVAVSPDGRFVYTLERYDVSSEATQTHIHTRDAATGMLSLIGTLRLSGMSYEYSLTFSPDGHYLYAYGGRLAVLAVDGATGGLSLVQMKEGTRWLAADDLAVSPDGQFLYGARDDEGIVVWQRGSDGQLTTVQTIGPDAIDGEALAHAAGVTLSPDVSRLYVSGTTGAVAVFSVDPASGTAAFVDEYVDAQDSLDLYGAGTMALTPDGSRLILANATSPTITPVRYGITVFVIERQTGALSLLRHYQPGADGLDDVYKPMDVVLSADGRYAYFPTTYGSGGSLAVFGVTPTPQAPEITVLHEGADVYSGQVEAIDFGAPLRYRPNPVVAFTVRNDGAEPLALSDAHLPGGFSLVDPLPQPIGPGATAIVTVQMSTADLGTFAGDMVLTTNDPDEAAFVVPLTGQVRYAPPTLWVGLDGEPLPYQFDLGLANIGSDISVLMTLRNDGTDDLQFRGWQFNTPVFTAKIVEPAGAGTIFMLAPLQTATLEVTFSTDIPDDHTGKMSLFSSDAVYTQRIFSLSASAAELDLELTCGGLPLTNGQAEPIDFGTLPPHTIFEPQIFGASNTSVYPLEITAVYATGPFLVTQPILAYPFTLDPGLSLGITVEATSEAIGSQSGTLVIESGTPGVGPFVIPLTSARREAVDGELTAGALVLNGVDGVTGMDRPFSVAVSPDGRDIYVGGADATSRLNWFRVETVDGERHLVRQTLNVALQNWVEVSMSPDGRNLYLIEGNYNIVVMSRDLATGQVAFVQRLSMFSNEPKEIAFSPDGRNVYVSDWIDNQNRHGLGVFSRDASTGRLTLDTLLLYGQGDLASLTRVTAIDVSSDGRHLYAGAYNGVLAVFDRDGSTGALAAPTLYQAWNDSSQHRWIDDVVVGPGGRWVYVSISGDKAYALRRDGTTGLLTPVHGAPDDPDLYWGVQTLAVAPDGATLYGCGGGGMLVFRIDALTGALTFAERIRNTGDTQGITPRAAVVSPDGAFVVTCSSSEDALLLLDRTRPVNPPTPIGVEAIVVNDGGVQRSTLTALSVRFGDDVAGGVQATDLMLIDIGADVAVDLTDAAIGFAYDPATRTATWDLSALALGNGAYEATLLGVAIPGVDANGDGRAGGTAVRAFQMLRGDFDGNGTLTVGDVDGLNQARRDGAATAPAFDLNGDGRITDTDADVLIDDILKVVRGDANADGSVDLDDFVALKQNFGIMAGATWVMADSNGDGRVDLDDFVLLKQNFGTAAASAPVEVQALATAVLTADDGADGSAVPAAMQTSRPRSERFRRPRRRSIGTPTGEFLAHVDLLGSFSFECPLGMLGR
ncbi:MAG: beta-propeller fold lactonase family protein [Planctomycetes bacterium]|nr:beta-propeller fold lactonase family protein [Planctomycetota bacterium]